MKDGDAGAIADGLASVCASLFTGTGDSSPLPAVLGESSAASSVPPNRQFVPGGTIDKWFIGFDWGTKEAWRSPHAGGPKERVSCEKFFVRDGTVQVTWSSGNIMPLEQVSPDELADMLKSLPTPKGSLVEASYPYEKDD